MNEIQLTKATTAAIATIRQLALCIWPTTFEKILSTKQVAYMLQLMYSKQRLLKDMQEGVSYYLLLYNNKAVGYAAIEKADIHVCKLHKIYIQQALHGKGLGKFLLQQMEAVAKQEGASLLKLHVNRSNRAVDFYKSQGYSIVKKEDIDIGNGFFMNDYIMEKKM